jgi:hypothetical protein
MRCLRRLAPAPARARNVAARGGPRVRDRVRGVGLSRRRPHRLDHRAEPRAAGVLAGLGGALPPAASRRDAVSQPGTRRDVSAHPRREPRRIARGRDRGRPARVLRGLRRRGDRPLLPTAGRVPHGRRPGRLGGHARVRRHVRHRGLIVCKTRPWAPGRWIAAARPAPGIRPRRSPEAESSTSSSSARSRLCWIATRSTAMLTFRSTRSCPRTQRSAPESGRRRGIGAMSRGSGTLPG